MKLRHILQTGLFAAALAVGVSAQVRFDAAGLSVVAISEASAQVIACPPAGCLPPPPPPGPPPPHAGGGGSSASPDTVDHSGNRWQWGTDAWVRLGADAAGNVILYMGHAKPSDYFWWNLGSAMWPGGGGALLALFQEDDGLVTNFVKGTWKCQARDRRPRCAIWVMQHAVHHHVTHRHDHRSAHRTYRRAHVAQE